MVLAVDDDDLVLLNTVAMLEDLGHRVIEATSGAEALKEIDSDAGIDLVVSDQIMPEMTGDQLAGAISRKRPGLPVILVSGYAEIPRSADPSIHRLAKPFTQRELAAALGTAIRGR